MNQKGPRWFLNFAGCISKFPARIPEPVVCCDVGPMPKNIESNLEEGGTCINPKTLMGLRLSVMNPINHWMTDILGSVCNSALMQNFWPCTPENKYGKHSLHHLNCIKTKGAEFTRCKLFNNRLILIINHHCPLNKAILLSLSLWWGVASGVAGSFFIFVWNSHETTPTRRVGRTSLHNLLPTASASGKMITSPGFGR